MKEVRGRGGGEMEGLPVFLFQGVDILPLAILPVLAWMDETHMLMVVLLSSMMTETISTTGEGTWPVSWSR